MLTVAAYKVLPSTFVPNEDSGYFIAAVSLPEGTSLNRTYDLMSVLSDEIYRIHHLGRAHDQRISHCQENSRGCQSMSRIAKGSHHLFHYNFGGSQIGDFMQFGRNYKIMLQSDAQYQHSRFKRKRLQLRASDCGYGRSLYSYALPLSVRRIPV